ncbi:SatD family protein [Georgenia sp. MJ173]|uniref:SatD family protein n=1 Tax=Georgenia sunbinii TaxID=3117728 RepID=UPI002F265C75
MRAVAIIVDIVKSRDLADRKRAQQEILRVFDRVAGLFVQSLWPTVGDEFQAVSTDISSAVRAVAIARLLLPPGMDCRFGIGEGDVEQVGEGATRSIQDGSAWWAAREAINEAQRRENRTNPYLRTWFVSDQPSGGPAAVVNAYLLLCDHAISAMRPRERRLTAGVLQGRSQSEVAEQEGITQSAVSQNLQRSGGGALLAAHQVLEDVMP